MRRHWWWWLVGFVGALVIIVFTLYGTAVNRVQSTVLHPDLSTPTVLIPNQTWFCNTMRSNGGLAHLVAATQADPSIVNVMALRVSVLNAPITVQRSMLTIYTDVRQHKGKAAVHAAVEHVRGTVPCSNG